MLAESLPDDEPGEDEEPMTKQFLVAPSDKPAGLSMAFTENSSLLTGKSLMREKQVKCKTMQSIPQSFNHNQGLR